MEEDVRLEPVPEEEPRKKGSKLIGQCACCGYGRCKLEPVPRLRLEPSPGPSESMVCRLCAASGTADLERSGSDLWLAARASCYVGNEILAALAAGRNR